MPVTAGASPWCQTCSCGPITCLLQLTCVVISEAIRTHFVLIFRFVTSIAALRRKEFVQDTSRVAVGDGRYASNVKPIPGRSHRTLSASGCPLLGFEETQAVAERAIETMHEGIIVQRENSCTFGTRAREVILLTQLRLARVERQRCVYVGNA